MNRSLFILAAFATIFLNSCSTTENVTQPENVSSFVKLQQKVITKTCVSCHTEGSNYANESGLVLDPDVAYANLISVPSHQLNASADKILRVKPGSADSSLLYMKVHGIPDNKKYGSPMPMGLPALTVGQQEFIRQWINAGAPKTGIVADAALLDDTNHYVIADFTALAPPAPGTGFQITTGKFDVGANFEREIFVFRKLGNSAASYVNRIQFKMRPNSHHLVLYTFDPTTPSSILPQYDVMRDLRNPNGSYITNTETQMSYHNFIGGSMIPEDDYYFPPGVALYLPANTGIDFNTHFINRTSSIFPGECYANIYTTALSSIQHVAFPLFLPNQTITLPASKITVVSQTYTNPNTAPMNVFMLTSHNHEWGQKFQIKISGGTRNGEIVYESNDWSHPLVKNFTSPIVLKKGEGLTSVVTYNNTTDHTIHFGLTSQDEMDIIYGYFY